MDAINQTKNDQIQAWTLQSPFLYSLIVPGSSQDRPRVHQDRKVEAPSMPNDTHGHQNLLKINKNPSLDLKVSSVMFPSVPKSAQGSQGRQSGATNHAK